MSQAPCGRTRRGLAGGKAINEPIDDSGVHPLAEVKPGGRLTTEGKGYRGVLRQNQNLQVGDQGEGLYGWGVQSMGGNNIAGGGGDLLG